MIIISNQSSKQNGSIDRVRLTIQIIIKNKSQIQSHNHIASLNHHFQKLQNQNPQKPYSSLLTHTLIYSLISHVSFLTGPTSQMN